MLDTLLCHVPEAQICLWKAVHKLMVKLTPRRRRRVGGNEDDGDEKALEGFEECKMASRPQLTFFLPLSLLQMFTSSVFSGQNKNRKSFLRENNKFCSFCVFVVLPLVHNLLRWSNCKPFLCKFEEQKNCIWNSQNVDSGQEAYLLADLYDIMFF